MEVYFGNLTTERGHMDKLAGEIESLVHEAEELVNASGSKLPEQERQRLAELLAQLKTSTEKLKLQAMKGFKATDRAIRTYPYQSAGVALVVGLVIGMLAGRPSHDES
jgi:ElaB/YqjD/DUF883 family membrane-anchored ribosome-binding protein